MDNTSVLSLKDVTVGYRKVRLQKEILSKINFELPSGHLVPLLGANGTGKSTLLRSIAGLQPVLSGDIRINGQKIDILTASELAENLSVVLTDSIQTGYLTVSELVALGRHPYTDWRGRLDETDRKITLEALEITGLTEHQQTNLYELSDGQLQKALIARALAQDGNIMLLDEPLVHLDIPSKWEIMGLLKQMSSERDKTIFLATHELELSLRMADRICLINKDRSLIMGTPEELVTSGMISNAFNSSHYKFEANLFKNP